MAYRYYEAVVNNDISRVDNINRDAERAKRILRSIARNQCAQNTINTICTDIESNDIGRNHIVYLANHQFLRPIILLGIYLVKSMNVSLNGTNLPSSLRNLSMVIRCG